MVEQATLAVVADPKRWAGGMASISCALSTGPAARTTREASTRMSVAARRMDTSAMLRPPGSKARSTTFAWRMQSISSAAATSWMRPEPGDGP